MSRNVLLVSTLSVLVSCGGNATGQKGAASPDEAKHDDVGSIGELAAQSGGIAALGGAGNREEGATGSEAAMTGTLRAEEVDKKHAPVRLDGVLKEWPTRAPAKETIAGSTEGLSLGVGVMYDDAKLYVAAEVTDPKGSRSSKHSESEDHVSMTLAFPSGRGAFKAYEVGFWAGKPGSSVGAVKWLAGPNKGQPIPGAKIVESDANAKGTGYAVEASIPWAAFPEARTMRVGLRSAFRYHSVDGTTKGVLATGPGNVEKPNELAPLPTAPEQAVVDGLLNQKNLAGEKPHIDIYADLAGDDRKERISVFGNFFTICGPGYRSGHQFFWREVAGDIVAVEARDVTGRGKEDLVVRKRLAQPTATHEILEVWSLVQGDEPVTVFAHQIAVASKDGKRKVTSSARISQKEIEVSVEPAVGWDAATFKETVASDIEPILLPWGTVKSRTFKFDRAKFAKAGEVAQQGKPAPSSNPSSAEPAQPALARDTSAPQVTKGSDLGRPPVGDHAARQVLEAYYKDAGVAPSTKPRFDFEIQLDGDGKRERILLVGRDIVVLGPAIRGGTGYARISLTQFEDEKDIAEVTARDLTGDGGAEIVVRGVRHVSPGGGGERVDVSGIFIYQVKNAQLVRVLAVETGREQGSKRVQGLVQFVPAKGKRGFDVDVRPGTAKGWTEKTYPWPQDKPGGSIEPLLLPWGNLPSLRYSWNGTQYALTP